MKFLKQDKFVFFICVLMSFLVYGISINYGMNWDDSHHIAENPHYQNISLSSLGGLWTKGYFGLYIPVTYTLWGFVILIGNQFTEFQLSNNWAIFHTLNVFVYGINCFLMFKLLKRFFSIKYSWLGTLLYLIHPINVETVVWLSEFRILVSNTFVFIALILLFDSNKSKKRFFAMAVCLVLGVLSKPSALVVLAIMILWYLYHRLMTVKYAIAFVFLALGTFLPVIYTKILQSNDLVNEVPTLVERLIIATYSTSFYVHKILIPWDYHHIYGQTPQVILSGYWFLDVVVSLALIAGLGYLLKFHRLYWYTLIAYISLVSLNSGIMPFEFQNYSTVANRYAALALCLMIMVLVYCMSNFRKLGLLMLFILVPLSISQSYQQLSSWSSHDSLWEGEVFKNPTQTILRYQWYGSHNSIFKKLGIAHITAEQLNDNKAHSLRVEVLSSLSKIDVAEKYVAGLENSPDSIYYDMLSNLSFAKKDYKKALSYYNKSINNQFKKVKECKRFYTIALYAEGKDYVLNNLHYCPLNHNVGPLAEFKKNIQKMKTQYPIEKDSNTHYSHTSNSKDVLNRILEFQTNGDYVGFKQYFEPILKNQSKQHPENFKTAIIFALNQQDPKSAEYFLNQYVDYYSFDQDEMLLEIARLYAIEGNGTEAYLRLQTLVAMESRLSPKAKELIPQVAPKEFLFEKHQ